MAGRGIVAVVVEALMTIGAVTGRIAAGIVAWPVRVLRHAPGAGVLRRGLSWRKRWADGALGTVGRLGKRVLPTGCLLLVIVTAVLLVALRQINSALGQMRLPGMAGGGALQFPLELDGRQAASAVDELRRSWSAYLTQIRPTRVIAEPTVLVERLFWLDLALIICYTVLLIVGLVMALRYVGRTGALSDVHRRMLQTALRCTLLLFVVDVLEDLALLTAYVHGWPGAVAVGWMPVGPVLSLAKFVLAALVIGVLLAVGVAMMIGSAPWRRAVVASRAVLIVVAIAVFLLATGIGADQVDDVIRAWDWRHAGFAMVASILAALVVVGTIRELTGAAADHPDPDRGADPVPLTVGIAVVLAVIGALCWAVGLGWGLLVPAGMALLGALLSLPIARFMPDANGHDPHPQPSDPEQDLVPISGLRLACVAGAGLLTLLIWVMARAATFDLAVRVAPTRWDWVGGLVCVSLLLAGVAGAILFLPAAVNRICRQWRWLWAVAVIVLLVTLVVPGAAVTVPSYLGTVAVLMLGVAAAAGVLAAAVAAARRGPALLELRLLPAVRVLGFRRLPAATLVVVWMVLVVVIDRGGFHDIRTKPAEQAGPPPTLEQAYRAWLAAEPESNSARPLVLVAAQGGGIRAAVWTALVMECVFGPGPVVRSEGCARGAGEVDLAAAGHTVRGTSLPVLLASGSSGGSVGLAAWSARRVDLASGGAVAIRTPRHVEDALADDFVATDLARMFISDFTYLLLAHNWEDRAEILEQAWEKAWPEQGAGLSRGLRETYQQANGAPGQWRIPILALNGTQVEDGCRLLASPVNFHVSAPGRTSGSSPEGDLDTPSDTACGSAHSGGLLLGVLPRTTELVDYLCPYTDVPLSTAAHLSARFPFVSPTGRVMRGRCDEASGLQPPGSISYAIDGGLFDNSGADTALEVWRSLAPLAVADENAQRRCVVPLFLQIDNSDPGHPELGPDSPPVELLAPVRALLGEVGSRETVARVSAATAFAPPRSPAGSPVRVDGRDVESLWFRVALTGQPGPHPPLGWTLAPSTVDDMRAQLSTEQNRVAIAQLRHLLTAPLRCG